MWTLGNDTTVTRSDDVADAVRNVQSTTAGILEHADASFPLEVRKSLTSMLTLMQTRRQIQDGVKVNIRLRLDMASEKLDHMFANQYRLRPRMWQELTRLQSEIEYAKSLRF